MEESDALCDNIKGGQATWRKGILGLADLTPLAIPSPQIMFIVIVTIFGPLDPLMIVKLEVFKVDALKPGTQKSASKHPKLTYDPQP